MKSYIYVFCDWKVNKCNFCEFWIVWINVGVWMNGLSYFKLMYGLKLVNIDINCKMFVDLVVNDVDVFKVVVDEVKKVLN